MKPTLSRNVFFALHFAFLISSLNAADLRGRQFIGFADFQTFSSSESSSEIVLASPRLAPRIPWDELVVSWNAEAQPGAWLKLEARGIFPERATKFYTLALWSPDDRLHPRESVNGQKDDDGDVLTDTLALKRRGAEIELRLTLGASPGVALPRLKFVGLSFADTSARPEPLRPNRKAWGKIIEVPERSQMIHDGGKVWCSPTSLSMALAHWSEKLRRSELNQTVPDTAKAVFDKNWPGTGNWPFNTAFAGSFAGMRAYVARLSDVSEIEDWIARGIPVIASVSYDVLKGKPKRPGDGHLVVCVGFTKTGEVIVNDPGVTENIRRVFPRETFARAWGHSAGTVYLIYPERAKVPRNRLGHWFR